MNLTREQIELLDSCKITTGSNREIMKGIEENFQEVKQNFQKIKDYDLEVITGVKKALAGMFQIYLLLQAEEDKIENQKNHEIEIIEGLLSDFQPFIDKTGI